MTHSENRKPACDGYRCCSSGPGSARSALTLGFFPRIAEIDLPAEAARLALERGLGRRHRKGRSGGADLPVIRAYGVSSDSVGKSIELAAFIETEMGKQYNWTHGVDTAAKDYTARGHL